MTKNLYQLAKEKIETKQHWSSGECATIWHDGQGTSAIIKEGGFDGGGLLMLKVMRQNGGPRVESGIQCGHISFVKGWVFDLPEPLYNRWAKDAREKVSGGKAAKPRK